MESLIWTDSLELVLFKKGQRIRNTVQDCSIWVEKLSVMKFTFVVTWNNETPLTVSDQTGPVCGAFRLKSGLPVKW